MGLPQWDVYIRVRLQASHGLPCGTIHGTLVVKLPESAPTLAACSVKAKYVKAKIWCAPWLRDLIASTCMGRWHPCLVKT